MEQGLARLPTPVAQAVRGQAAAHRLRRAKGRARRLSPVFSDAVHPGDEMFDHALPYQYFDVGWSALKAVEAGLAEAGVAEVGRILDVPCGHGRVLRMLRARWPGAAVTACDLNREGVDFCVASFAARGVYSANPITDVDAGEDYDLVWVGSLLTHLDSSRWPEMLEWMRDRLRRGGVLVVTTHGSRAFANVEAGADYGLAGDDLARVVESYTATGFGYSPYPWDRDYGISMSRADFVSDTMAKINGLELVSVHQGAWADHHDVVTLQRI